MRALSGLFLLLTLCATAQAKPFKVKSTDLQNGKALTEAQVFDQMGCTGKNLSPQLSWENPPAGTQSFAITVYDPDAPTGSGWWHWQVFNLPANTTALPTGAAGALPIGAEHGPNDAGVKGFCGACPPPGDKPHRYFFTVFALDVAKLELPPNASAALIGAQINAHTLAKATLKATYRR